MMLFRASACLLFLLVSFNLATAEEKLTAEKIAELSKKPHDRSSISEEMKIFSDVRKWDIEIRISSPGNLEGVKPEAAHEVTEKMVESRYLVTRLTNEVGMPAITMVVLWDADLQAYRKFTRVALPDGKIHLAESRGIRLGKEDKRIAWSTVSDPTGSTVISMEKHEDRKVVFREHISQEGKWVTTVDGVAVPAE